MSESSPTAAELLAMSGTENANLGTKRPTKNEGLDYFNSIADEYDRFEKSFGLAGGGRVFKDGTATYGVRPIKFHNGTTDYSYAGCSGQALTVAATNKIYLTISSDATSVKKNINTSSFPAISTTPHVQLATIIVGASTYDETTAITDERQASFLTIQSIGTAANTNTLLKGATSNATALHNHTQSLSAAFQLSSGPHIVASSTTQLAFKNAAQTGYVNIRASAVQGAILSGTGAIKYAGYDIKPRLPRLKLSAAVEASDIIRTYIKVQDVLSAANANRFLVRTWLASGAAFNTATVAPNSAITCSVGTIVKTITSGVSLEIATSANGIARLGIKHTAAKTFQLNAEIDGFITTQAIVFA